uniref:NADH dehydrogenase subunit 6 n=1 Tax=Russula rosea TaxID=176822 RepID=UPI002027E9CD|nr:NADH dehydrogenase subunit 6 [Russula rosea]UHA57022.1 NADH dehydrogenase subunit 6 [Russula rosea]
MKILLINILSFTTIISSVLVITSKNPVISVVYLISVFVNAAGYLILSGIGFLGLSYIIVYVGAITVLFLFVIMMINISLTDIIDTGKQYTKNLPLAFAVGSLFLFEMFNILPFSFNNVSGLNLIFDTITNFNLFIWNNNKLNFVNIIHTTYQSNIADTIFISFSQIEAIGQLIYTYAAILLIICSIILLLSMIAPIFISLNKK